MGEDEAGEAQVINGRENEARVRFALPFGPVSSTVVARRSRKIAPEGGNMATKITRDIIESYLNCKYKGHLKLAGESGTPSDYEAMTTAARQVSRESALAKLAARFGEGDACRETAVTAATLKQGKTLLVDAELEDEGLSLRCDALKRADGVSKLGDYHYVPVLHQYGDKVGRQQKILLALHGLALARVQGLRPAVALIVRGPEARLGKVHLDAKLYRQVEQILEELKRLQAGGEPPRLTLNRHCQVCEFRQRCRKKAEEADDISLLGGLAANQIAALNGRGIFTLTQYSYTFRAGRMKRVAGKKHDHSLQALALREKTVYVAKRPELPDGKARLFLDVEGLPNEGCYYLIGLTILEGDSRRHLSFWADGKAEERSIWSSFLEEVQSFEDFVLFHYGSYESKSLEQMAARHGGDPGVIARLKDRSVNVLSLIYSRVYFPVHSNDLKSVAGCLGFRWSAPDASGLQSIVWRHGWEATGDEFLKQRLLTYNQEDCAALAKVVESLCSFGSNPQPGNGSTGPRVAAVEDIEVPRRHKFCNPEYVLPEFVRITKCAYFDYQRDKVLFRTSPTVRRSIRCKKRRKQRTLKVNREIECGRPAVCPHCGSSRLGPHSPYQHLVIDLKPSRVGLKRWLTRYKVRRLRCGACKHTSFPDEYLAVSAHKYGPGLCSWVVYSSISLRQTNETVADALNEVFGIHIPLGSLSVLIQRAADRYRATYESLLTALRAGQLVHADETKVRTRGSSRSGYVWAFANPEIAVYVYSPTRDGDTPRDTLAGFRGVLVSDFYAAYDSLDCPQQKCLIHLVRDLNDDLLKHPFDEELKQMTVRFAGLLQAVVETIDRYGLKKYHLHKHKKDVDRYFAVESQAAYESEIAQHYQQRVLKYRDKLFTFLDHDGVPWNNNNAENAIKRFVARRKIVGPSFSEDGLRQYLLLLSIYQTLRYRGLSFWRFLLSGQTDIDAFAAQCRRSSQL
jgi:predicted RecB family nuclease